MSYRDQLLGGGAVPLPTASLDTIQIKAPPGKPQPKLAICLPSFSDVKADHADCYAGAAIYMASKGYALAMCREKSSMITAARNNLAERAVEMNADWIFFCDSDMAFPHDAIERLIAHDKDICGATYNKRVPPYQTLGRLRNEDPVRGPATPAKMAEGGLWEAEYLPGGFMLIKAAVLKAIPKPWFYETYLRPGNPFESFLAGIVDDRMLPMPPEVSASLAGNETLVNWLNADWPHEPQNRTMSEDFSFCKKARRHGFTIWCDLGLTWQMKHIGEHHVTCLPPEAQAQQPADNPAVVMV